MISRDELNKHLTTNVILRIDYVPIANELVDIINNEIAENFLGEEKCFEKVKESLIRAIDIKIKDPSIQDLNDFANVNETARIKSYEYFKLIDGRLNIKLIFNRQFAAIEIDQNILYHSFEEYKKIIFDLLEILKTKEIKITRFGLRKFNHTFLKEDVNIYEYFCEMFFKLECDSLLDKELESLISEKRFAFKDDYWNVNLITHTSKGTLDEVPTTRIAFDIDVFVDKVDVLKCLFEEEQKKEFLNEANNKVFCIYQKLLNTKMISLLKKESALNDSNIIYGVEYNGKN